MKDEKVDRTKGYICAIVSSVLFGLMAVLVKFALMTGLHPFDVVFFRFFFTFFIIAAYVFFRRINLKISKGQCCGLLFLSIIGYAAMNLTYYGAFNRMSVGLTGMLHYIYPVAAVVIARLIYHEKIGKSCYIAVILSVSGTMLLSMGDITQMNPIGIFLALLSGILYGIYAVGLGRPFIAQLNGYTVVFYLCLFSTLFMGGVEYIRGINPFAIISLKGLLFMLAISLFCTGFAMLIFREAIVSVGSVSTTILSTLEPITAVILSLIFLEESFTILMVIGSALILTAVILTVGKSPTADSTLERFQS